MAKRGLKPRISKKKLSKSSNEDIYSPIDPEFGISKVGLGSVIICTFLVYYFTSFPTLTAGDSGELLSASCTLGVAHPPGYPLFIWINKIAMVIGDFFNLCPARSGNLLAVILSSVSSGLIYLTIEACTDGDIISSMFGSLMCAFSPLIWQYSIQAEVFALNNVIISTLAYLSVCYFRYSKKYALIGAFFVGIAGSNQHTSIFLVAPIVLSVILESRSFFSDNLEKFVLYFLAGFSPYIHLPIASFLNAKVRWGDQKSISGFLTHLLRREYGTFQLASSQIAGSVPYVARLQTYIMDFLSQSLFVGAFCAFYGVYHLFQSNKRQPVPETRKALTIFCWSILIYILVFHYLNNLDHKPILLGVQMRFWMQPNILLFILSGFGLHLFSRNAKLNRIFKISFVFSLLVSQISWNYDDSNRSQEDLFSKFASMHLKSMPNSSIILVNGDTNHYSFSYSHFCENVRADDIDLISVDHMSFTWFHHQFSNHPNVKFPKQYYNPFIPQGYSFLDFFEANIKRPIYICGSLRDDDPTTKGNLDSIKVGMCQRLILKEKLEDLDKSQKFLLLKQGYLSVPSLTQYGGYHSVKHSIYTWESKLFRESYFALTDLFVEISSQAVLIITNFENNIDSNDLYSRDMVILGSLVCDKMVTYFEEPFLFNMRPIDASGYRMIGFFYGKHSQIEESNSKNLAEKMFYWWSKYVERSPADEKISRFINEKINPFK